MLRISHCHVFVLTFAHKKFMLYDEEGENPQQRARLSHIDHMTWSIIGKRERPNWMYIALLFFQDKPCPTNTHIGTSYFDLFVWGLLAIILSPKNVRFELKDPDLV